MQFRPFLGVSASLPAPASILGRTAVALSMSIGAVVAQDAKGAAEMQEYSISLPPTTGEGAAVEIPMVPIRVGEDGYPETFLMGSPADEAGRGDDEGPQVRVKVEPLWIGKFEITWDVYNRFRAAYVAQGGEGLGKDAASAEQWADAVSLPTPLYEQDSAPILEGMGTAGGFPVANISQFAARQFTKWLSVQTGQFYRLPTEAEWEYVARAGTDTAFDFGDDPADLESHGWFFDNSLYDDPNQGHPDFGAGYRKVGSATPNAWGVFDMHGNVAEWCLDQYVADRYAGLKGDVVDWRDAVVWPVATFPCVVRGGSWEADAERCRAAARIPSTPAWQERDPQLPKSIWWFTDAFHVGFRIVRPLRTPSREEQLRAWESQDEGTLEILATSGKEIRAALGDGEGRKKDGDER